MYRWFHRITMSVHQSIFSVSSLSINRRIYCQWRYIAINLQSVSCRYTSDRSVKFDSQLFFKSFTRVFFFNILSWNVRNHIGKSILASFGIEKEIHTIWIYWGYLLDSRHHYLTALLERPQETCTHMQINIPETLRRWRYAISNAIRQSIRWHKNRKPFEFYD